MLYTLIQFFTTETFEILTQQINYTAVFLINFFIAAIGAYLIYAIVAGIVAVGLTYLFTNGNRKALWLSLIACFLGIAIGLTIRLVTLL